MTKAPGVGGPSVGRALAILDLLDDGSPSCDADRVAVALGVSVPTAYRYLRDLVAAGMMRRLPKGRYVLGPRIIQLDYAIRQSDPLLHAAVPEMRALTRRSGFDCVLSTLYGDHILDTHREPGADPLPLAYGRGRPRPMFQGAAPKVILAGQPVPWLRRMHAAQAGTIAAHGMGQDWAAFRAGLGAIRRHGAYVSRGELEVGLCGVAAPIPSHAGAWASAIALVASRERFELMNLDLLTRLVRDAAERIGHALAV